MKLGPATKLDKRNKTTTKQIDDDIMSENCDVIAIFPMWSIWSNLEAGFWTHSL